MPTEATVRAAAALTALLRRTGFPRTTQGTGARAGTVVIRDAVTLKQAQRLIPRTFLCRVTRGGAGIFVATLYPPEEVSEC